MLREAAGAHGEKEIVVVKRSRKKTAPLPTPAEARLLRALWALGEATVEEIVGYFPPSERPNYKTAQTVLRIMETKGFLTHSVSGKAFLFRAVLSEQEAMEASVDSLVHQSFGGSIRGLMVNLIEGGKLKRSDLLELEDLIQRHKQSNGKGAQV